MRASNLIGAFIVFITALVIDLVFLETFYTWITNAFEGTTQTVIYVALGMFFLFITIILPLLIVVEDRTEKDTIIS